MKLFRLDDVDRATGTVVVIDVLRAFTTAAYAFAGGAEQIVVVSQIDQAFALRSVNPDWLLMGELNGRRIDDFDFSNSPFEVAAGDVNGRTIVQRTTAGTQGVTGAINADKLYCGSLVCASAIARELADDDVSYVITGHRGDEDVAGAEYIEACRTSQPDPLPFITRVRDSYDGIQLLTRPEIGVPEVLDLACDVDVFDFAIQVERTPIGIVARSV